MREHQIVITLKPEQFLEVQRLARAAGAKSMGMFVRQKLLTALGVEGSPEPATKAPSGQDLKRLAAELSRLHGELRAFVAESLVNNLVVEEQASEAAAETDTGSATPDYDLASDWPENDDRLSELDYSEPDLPTAPASGRQGQKTPPSAGQAIMEFEQAQDDLEGLAQRAFAISPRLGALQEYGENDEKFELEPDQSGRSEDPLDDLLDDPGSKTVDGHRHSSDLGVAGGGEVESDSTSNSDDEDEDEDEIIDVPLPIGESSQLKQEWRRRDETKAPPAPPSRKIPQPPPPNPPKPSAGGSSGPSSPPFSGGPPPRRRQ